MPHKYMIRLEHPFDIRPDLRKAETTKAETTTTETVIRPKQLVRGKSCISSKLLTAISAIKSLIKKKKSKKSEMKNNGTVNGIITNLFSSN